MKKINALFVSLFLLVLSGCAQKLPLYQDGMGLVALPFKVSNSSSLPLLRSYEFKSSSDDAFSLIVSKQSNSDLVLSEPIPAGRYTIDTIIIRIIPSSEIITKTHTETVPIEAPFDVFVNGGELVLLDTLWSVHQYEQGRMIRQNSKTEELSEADRKRYLSQLDAMENSGQWTLR